MVRTVGSNGEKTKKEIRRAALRLIYEHGYDGTNIRQLAAAVGVSQGSLYNHVSSKQELLFDMLRDHMNNALEAANSALPEEGSATSQLERFINFHLTYHMTKREEVFVINSELRSLSPKNFKIIVALRRRYELILIRILQLGQRDGSFCTFDVRVVAYSLLGMLTTVFNWYRQDGRLSCEQIVELHRQLILQGISADGSSRTGISKKPNERIEKAVGSARAKKLIQA